MVVSSPGAPAQRPPLRSHPAVPEAHAPRLPPPPGLSQRDGHPGTARGVSGPPAAPSPRRWLEAGLRGRARAWTGQALPGAGGGRSPDEGQGLAQEGRGLRAKQPPAHGISVGGTSVGGNSPHPGDSSPCAPGYRTSQALGPPPLTRALLSGQPGLVLPGQRETGPGLGSASVGASALSQALRVHPGPRARGGGPRVHMLRQSVLRSWGPSTPAVPRARPPPRPRHPLPPPRAAGARPSRAPGAEAAGRPLPAWRLAHGRGQHGSRLRLIKCPSLMSFSN